ncbi:hypothetical protein CHLNCDRAFT_144035 [Chlorella variabilis]|uniref:Uncharacterized protein n=1 Tax=Chlorella variabilis TaxID=554065 RepID=E1ZUR4_CHLVA|nr:hypothetical protein CHLNCDRAFT_144035 [Chlorella variabilis]EFN50431.1 hypothetical protein CHLNCDRAFT_144035 [Chlorella variabilis]|eukprot:XP_005842563.1 hypothetical protein CHLNCDRAFT_144035 [Chlorella variabilis]
MIGNWRHPPNLDSARWACSEIWPALRAALPSEHRDAQLHMYGSYAAGAAQQLHRPKEGVHMKGFAPSLDIMLRYRVLLAPLRYGAGLKGKVVDSWWHGLPVATTPIGAEGMTGAAAAPAVAAAEEVVVPDEAAEGYVWQLGGDGCGEAAAAAGREGEWGGLCGATSAHPPGAATPTPGTSAPH